MILLFVTTILLIILLALQEQRLFRVYRQKVNPSYLVLMGEKPESSDPTGIKWMLRALKIIFSKYPRDPDLAREAKRVRVVFAVLMAVMILGPVVVLITILTSTQH